MCNTCINIHVLHMCEIYMYVIRTWFILISTQAVAQRMIRPLSKEKITFREHNQFEEQTYCVNVSRVSQYKNGWQPYDC